MRYLLRTKCRASLNHDSKKFNLEATKIFCSTRMRISCNSDERRISELVTPLWRNSLYHFPPVFTSIFISRWCLLPDHERLVFGQSILFSDRQFIRLWMVERGEGVGEKNKIIRKNFNTPCDIFSAQNAEHHWITILKNSTWKPLKYFEAHLK